MSSFYVKRALDALTQLNTAIAERDYAVRGVEWLARYVPVRHRYMLTRQNRLRLRYTAPSVACVMALALTTAAGFATSSRMMSGDYSAFDGGIALTTEERDFGGRVQATHRRMQRYLGGDETAQAQTGDDGVDVDLAAIQPRAVPQPRERNVEIGKGDTLAAVLHRAGVSSAETHIAMQALRAEYDPRTIRPGQNVYVRMEPVAADSDDESYQLSQMGIVVDSFRSVALRRNGDKFTVQMEEKPVERRVYARKAPIEVSLYGSASKAGVPNAAIAEVIRIMSWDVDFQRDIRRGDLLEVMYDQKETADSKGVRFGEVLFARMNINGKAIEVYRYEPKGGRVDYFTADGNSVRKALMMTPVDGARVSSGYGMRKHPVLGYSRMHKGVDFAAPTGTPIFAAGDGTVEKAGRWGAYGNYVRIRHNGNIKTAYAHMNGYGKGVTTGARVTQGQVIGYVGATGRVTGPHLHYEVLMNNEHINPNSVRLPTGTQLKGPELAAFKLRVQEVNRQYADLLGKGERMKVASAAGALR